jgi:hypothetical protein
MTGFEKIVLRMEIPEGIWVGGFISYEHCVDASHIRCKHSLPSLHPTSKEENSDAVGSQKGAAICASRKYDIRFTVS